MGHSTIAVTEDGTAEGKIVGLVTSRDYRVTRMDPATKVSEFMTPFEKLIYAEEGVSLKEANDIIWDHKLNALPIIGKDRRLKSFVFRKDYDAHKENPNELLDSHKRYIVGRGHQYPRLCGKSTGVAGGWRGCALCRLLRRFLRIPETDDPLCQRDFR